MTLAMELVTFLVGAVGGGIVGVVIAMVLPSNATTEHEHE